MVSQCHWVSFSHSRVWLDHTVVLEVWWEASPYFWELGSARVMQLPTVLGQNACSSCGYTGLTRYMLPSCGYLYGHVPSCTLVLYINLSSFLSTVHPSFSLRHRSFVHPSFIFFFFHRLFHGLAIL